ncbi:MAG: sugar phosphate isomerase/epimerase [Halioglobus sp.]
MLTKNTSEPILSLCWGSMEGVDLETFVAVAANAGFQAVTLNSAYYAEALRKGYKDNDVSQLLIDHGLTVSNIDPLFNWLPSSVRLDESDPISLCTQASMEEVFHLAHVAGTDIVNAPIGLANPDSEQQIIDCFATLCERAKLEQLRVSLEFMPFNQVANLATAVRIVEQAGCDNGGIMFDCWHHHRSGGKPEDILGVPGEKIIAMQLDDAMVQPMDDIVEETLNHRLLPGEGCINLVETLRALRSSGAKVIYDVEVFKATLRTEAPEKRAQLMFDAASAIIRQM